MAVALRSSSSAVSGRDAAAPQAGDLFSEITVGLADGRELHDLLGEFLAPIVRLAGAQAGLVRVLSDDDQSLRLVGDLGLPAHVLRAEQLVDRHCGACGVATDAGLPTWATDLHACKRNAADLGYFGVAWQRMLVVPLRHRARVLGVYNLFFDAQTELSAAVESMLRSVGQLLGLALHNARLERQQLRATVMSERRFMAGEVHDSIAQQLVYARLRLPLLRSAVSRQDQAQALTVLGEVEQTVGRIQTQVRELLTQFRTSMDPQGLVPALRTLVEEFRQRSVIEVSFDCDAVPQLSAQQELELFHIVQEALANVFRHARAQRVWLSLHAQAGGLAVCVEDDGQGFAQHRIAASGVNAEAAHFGLDIMRERAQRLGAGLDIGVRTGGGTRLRLVLPLGGASIRGAA